MALVQYGNGIVDARGSVGGSTLSRSKAGPHMRAKISGTQPLSSSRSKNQSTFAMVSRRWSVVLTPIERAAWNQFALINPATNRFGQTKYYSGFQWFCKCNINNTNGAGGFINTPPVFASTEGAISLTFTAAHAAGGSISLAYTTAGGGALGEIGVYATRPLSPGLSFVSSQMRFVGFFNPGGLTLTFSAEYKAQISQLSNYQGKQIFGMITGYDNTAGICSPGILTTTLIT